MKHDIQKEMEARVLEEAEYFVAHKSTVRKTAEYFGRSKSSVHTDLTKRLPECDRNLSRKVRRILKRNWEERALRGGNATRQMKLLLKKQGAE